jgi:hypothetical protein
MLRVSLRSLVVVLSLGLSLTSGASAAPLRWGGLFSEGGPGLLDRLEAVFLGGVHLKRGCSIDPDGNLACGPKAGCSISPDGMPKCPPVIAPKLGCSIDPNGRPVCTP